MKHYRLTSLILALSLASSVVVNAQSYDDDDIYYNPEKAKAEKLAKKSNATRVVSNSAGPRTVNNNTYYINIPAADSYTPGAHQRIDVDSYNRRGIFASVDSTVVDSTLSDDFAYTRRIERFYNPDIITSSSDNELTELYYSTSPTVVNINVIEPDYLSYAGFYPGYWCYTYYYNPYRPWITYPYSWSSGWDYGPSWAWGYGPSWGWSFGPTWAWGPSWGWTPPHHPSWGHRPPAMSNRPAGNIRPGMGGNTRPSMRPGSSSSAFYPGNSNARSMRPAGNVRPSQRSSSSSGSYRGGYDSGSSRGSSSSTGSYRGNNRGSSSSSSGSYRSGGYSGGSRGSSGGFSGGSRGGSTGRGRH